MKSRYKQSIIGYVWIILNPLLQMLVYSFVFSIVFRFPTGGVSYPLFLFIGLIPWIYFQNTIVTSTLTLVENANLIKKVYFPREILLYSVSLSKGVDYLFASSLLAIFILLNGLTIQPTVLFVIPLLAIQIILASGVSLFTAVANLFYRDIQHLVTLLIMLWLYLTPVVYPLSLVPPNYVFLYKLNPMVGIIEGYRSAIFNTPFDSGTIVWSAVISMFIFLLGFILFRKSENIFADIV